MSIDHLAQLAQPRVVAPLDMDFRPAVLANREFRRLADGSGQSIPLVIGLECSEGQVAAYRTVCFAQSSGLAYLNRPYVERIVKFLLWQKGGWRLTIGGSETIGNHLQGVYSSRGGRAFDVGMMERIYQKPFTVETTNAVDDIKPRESARSAGGNLDGCRIGFDLGASDRKVSAVIDGEPVYTEEVNWNPGQATDPDYHFNEINCALKAAAKHLPRVDAIGGSAAGAYVDNRPRAGSIFRGIPRDIFDSKTVNLFVELRKVWGGVPFEVANDGEVAALAGAMSLGEGAVLGIAMGSSEAGGYVTPDGKLTTWLNELAFTPGDYSQSAPEDEWSGDRGCGAQYFSQQAVFRLAQAAGIHIDTSLGLAERLLSVQKRLQAGDDRARSIWETIGVYTGYGIAHYADFYELRHVLLLGRVTSGDGGSIILDKAREVLRAEFPEHAETIEIHLPDEKSRRIGQAVAAASLPTICKQEHE